MFLFHEELLNEWMHFLTRKPNTQQHQAQTQALEFASFKEILLQSSWFFFDLMTKSIATYLNLKTSCLTKMFYFNQNNHQQLNNTNQTLNTYCTRQLSQKFLTSLDKLIKTLITEVVFLVPKYDTVSLNGVNAYSVVNLLNCSLAFFIEDLFSFIDRGFLFKEVDFYFREINKCLSVLKNNTNKSSSSKYSMKMYNTIQLDFLRILSSHEHFLALNLPLFSELNELIAKLAHANPNAKSGGGGGMFNLTFNSRPIKLIIESKEFFSKHYFVGVIIRKVFKSLHSPFTGIQYKAVELIRNLLESHDLDSRLSSAAATNITKSGSSAATAAQHSHSLKSRIAYMYFPLVNLIIHFIPFMLTSLLTSRNGTAAAQQANGSELDEDLSTVNETDCFSIDDVFLNDYDVNILIDKINDIDNGYLNYFDSNFVLGGNLVGSGQQGGCSGGGEAGVLDPDEMNEFGEEHDLNELQQVLFCCKIFILCS
jgi:hypothetical protein